MADIQQQVQQVFARILKDIRVELKDEFDQNFEREAFFSEKWTRRKSPVHGGRSGHLLVDSGTLRGSIRSEIKGDSVFFSSDLPYAGIHNDGGEIVVTARMRRFFWAKYREANGGTWGRGGRTATHSTNVEAEFWKMMALKKVGSVVKIPRRRFLGVNAEVEKIVTGIVEDGLKEYFENEFNVDIRSL
jgi:phage gpG-like protein